MARAKKEAENLTVNIKSMPIKAHAGASKYINDDWGTVAFFIPRNSLGLQFADIELQYNCIYFLVGFRDLEWLAYVGQAKKRNSGGSVLKRLREHADSTTEKYRNDWDWVIVVTNKDDAWGLDDLNALENAFYHEIPTKKNLNGNTPNSAGADFNSYLDKIKQIKAYIAILGFDIFEQTEDIEKVQVTSVTNEYTIVEDLQNGMARIPEIVTPQRVVKDMVDMLEKENPDIWSPDKTFLDPACKGGEYLYEIYTRLMESETMKAKFPSDIARAVHILQNQVYGIALSQVSLDRTVNKLNGFGQNIKIIPNYISILKSKDLGTKADGKAITFKDKISEVFGKDMKFDVVIGNPPYQENTGKSTNNDAGRQTKPIYDKFIEAGLSLTDRFLIFITNNTFLTNDSKKELRDNMIRAGLKELINYPVSGEVFKGMGVSACIFSIDKQTANNQFKYRRIEDAKIVNEYVSTINVGDIIAESKYELDIPKRIKTDRSMGDISLGVKTFWIGVNGRIGFDGRGEFVSISPIEFDNSIKIKNKINGFVDIDYIDRDDIPKGHEYIDLYKVICPYKISKKSLTSFGKAEILPPQYICTEGWAVVGAFASAEESSNCIMYINSKLFKFLCYTFCSNGMTAVTKVLLSHVPLQDFTSNSDIDWSKSMAEIDQQLYKKYGLSAEEIEYIENTIKPME